MKIKYIVLRICLLIGVIGFLSACTNEPNATIRDVEKTNTQVTISIFLEDPNNSVERVDIMLMDDKVELISATNKKETDSLEGLWDVTLPMGDVEDGTYEIVIRATLSNDETTELVTESLDWP